jgi:hypothetical protein
MKQFSGYAVAITTVLSVVLIFVDIPEKVRFISGGVLLFLLIIIYLLVWHRANASKEIHIKIGVTDIEIKTGNLFEQEGLKAVACNEYFDTEVDDIIIVKRSLNGQVIEKYIKDVSALDHQIETDQTLIRNISGKNENRVAGKKIKYNLGSSVLVDDEFIFTAFARFNEKNEAELTMKEYIDFLITFWNEINRLYALRTVSVPVFGSGITRFKNGFEDVDINELLHVMIWTFKVSKIKVSYPAKLQIIIHEDKVDKINLYEIKEKE